MSPRVAPSALTDGPPPVAPSALPPRGAPLADRRSRIRGGCWVGAVLFVGLCVVAGVAPSQAQPAATAAPATAPAAVPASADPALDARVQAIANELRCLVCQNQTIAESHAGLAVDLRRQVREMLARGDSERQVIDYMTARYGDFVLYRPPVKPATALLWYGPGVLLLLAAGGLIFTLRRRSRLPGERFEPEPEDAATGSWIDPRTRPASPAATAATGSFDAS